VSSLHSPVSAYYDQNTAPFLRWFGSGLELAAIHRQVWGPGVRSGREAFEYLNELVADLSGLRNLTGLNAPSLDLGCGLGGTATWIAERFEVNVIGLTVSRYQALLANERAAQRGLAHRCRFVWGDFLQLPDLGPFHAVWAIESFAHATDAEQFFLEAARATAPGARLVVCDDFLAQAEPPGAAAERWLGEFRAGWRLSSLLPVNAAKELAARYGFQLVQADDLTPCLRPAPAWLLNLGEFVLRLPVHTDYVRSLRGSLALQKCLRGGWTQYHALTWERAAG
jgi:SAM-dependent methyltransferase